jgi:prepilin-type N-terminal cleavage/methylation domain-containing protein
MGFHNALRGLRGSWRQAGGFTIIELLVVIVIVGILAAAGSSKYQGIVEGARQKTCVGNLYMIDQAVTYWYVQNRPMNEGGWELVTFDTFGKIIQVSAEVPQNYPPFTGNDIANAVRDRRVWVCPKMMQRQGYSVLSDVPASVLTYCAYPTITYGGVLLVNIPPNSGTSYSSVWYSFPNDATLGFQVVLCMDSGVLKMSTGPNCPADIGVKYRHSTW